METRRNCPYCSDINKTEDTKEHLYINENKKLFYCHRCNKGGKWDGLILPGKTKVKRDFGNIDMFTFDIKTDTSLKVFTYCIKRLPERVVRDRIRWSPQIPNRAFFPVWKEDKIVVWQARSIDDSLPKYLSYGSLSNYLYNFDAVKDYAVLCEGPFDALSTPHGVGLFGKNLSDVQRRLLLSKFVVIFWALDKDTKGELKLFLVKEKLREKINIIDLPLEKKDPNEEGYLNMKKMVDKALILEAIGRKNA